MLIEVDIEGKIISFDPICDEIKVESIREPNFVAKPATRGMAEKDGIPIADNIHIPKKSYRNKSTEGYILHYNETKLWIPKIAFDKKFRNCSTIINQMQNKLSDLTKDINELRDIIKNDKFKGISRGMRSLMISQYHYMNWYKEVLSARINLMLMTRKEEIEKNPIAKLYSKYL